MKELSIEEKARAYDKAFEAAKEEYNKYNGLQLGDVLEDIFPELIDFEHEMIKKQIIRHIIWSEDNQFCTDVEKKRWIAWLEKQGEHAKFKEYK